MITVLGLRSFRANMWRPLLQTRKELIINNVVKNNYSCLVAANLTEFAFVAV